MKSYPMLFVVFLSLLLGGCSSVEKGAEYSPTVGDSRAQVRENLDAEKRTQKVSVAESRIQVRENLDPAEQTKDISYTDNGFAKLNTPIDRKIISVAELTLEVASPSEAQQKIGSIAANAGGFVVNSETKQRDLPEAKHELEVTLTARVPSNQFDTTLQQIRATGSRVVQQKISGDDVTEEYIDLEARLKTQRALETQFLEIMKQARKISDALEVQRQMADVRTEIERLEGRRRFLENRASLATITVTLRTPAVIAVNTSSFGRSIREAAATSVDLATGIVLFIVRALIVLLPIALFIGLPATLIARYLVRRGRRIQLARELESAAPAE